MNEKTNALLFLILLGFLTLTLYVKINHLEHFQAALGFTAAILVLFIFLLIVRLLKFILKK